MRIQTMTNTLTSQLHESVKQCLELIRAGAELVRLTVPSMADVHAFAQIRNLLRQKGIQTPLVADVHFNPDVAIQVAEFADKVRINPGNFQNRGKFIELIEACRKHQTALRIGVNHGSLSESIMNDFGDTPEGMVESAMEFLRLCRQNNFDQVIVSMKSSNVRVMVQSTRLLSQTMDKEGLNFPLHLGVTEAGDGEDGRIKSACGIGVLLADGLGDTIRVSLTELPKAEIPVAKKLLSLIEEFARPIISSDLFSVSLPWPHSFERRKSRTTGNVGGQHPPVVIGFDKIDENQIDLIRATREEINETFLAKLASSHQMVLVYECTYPNPQVELRWLRSFLDKADCNVPIILKWHGYESDTETFIIRSACSLGGAFLEGFGDGIWLTNENKLPGDKEISTALGILQACRARMSKTEYIACPSCGRTHFNLIDTLAKVKLATAHLKGLKIGVMGCIVNGPGEMADADYGYVGTARGKVTLYKAREVMKKSIPEDEAVDELIRLIKANDDWVDPEEAKGLH